MPRALLLILALLQASGIAEVVRRQACQAECRGDGCDNDCTGGDDAPACPCHCPAAPSMATPAIAAAPIAAPIEGAPIVFDRTERRHPSPDPREILHVPRRSV